jgi:SAM-dependent methyltransferase
MRHPNFDPIARPYRFLEYLTLGPILQLCRTHHLPKLYDRKQALILGDGDGRFLAKLLATNPNIQADAVDTSATMLQLLRERCQPHTARLHTHTCSALTFVPTAAPDLITAHFFFDCLSQPDLDTLIARLAKHTRPGTLWLISDFRIPTGPLRRPAQLYIRALYLAFRLVTGLQITRLPNHEAPLKRAGLTRTDQHLSLFGLLTTEIWTRTIPQ